MLFFAIFGAQISIHALLAESDYLVNTYHRIFGISIHALLAESDIISIALSTQLTRFLSTLSLRRATAIDVFLAVWAVISIHALLAESDCRHFAGVQQNCISIHALLAESDLAGPSGPAISFNFYPRSPCGERRVLAHHARKIVEFLSTLSLRRATVWMGGLSFNDGNFYPRSPCGERQYQ